MGTRRPGRRHTVARSIEAGECSQLAGRLLQGELELEFSKDDESLYAEGD